MTSSKFINNITCGRYERTHYCLRVFTTLSSLGDTKQRKTEDRKIENEMTWHERANCVLSDSYAVKLQVFFLFFVRSDWIVDNNTLTQVSLIRPIATHFRSIHYSMFIDKQKTIELTMIHHVNTERWTLVFRLFIFDAILYSISIQLNGFQWEGHRFTLVNMKHVQHDRCLTVCGILRRSKLSSPSSPSVIILISRVLTPWI